MASEVAKQRLDHVCAVQPGGEASFLAPMPIRALVGVGPKSETRLLEAGTTTIGALALRPLEEVVALFGRAYGRYLHDASRGMDDTVLQPNRVAKSRSAEHTFPADATDRHMLWQELRSQADEVAARLRQEGLRTSGVAIKLRNADWETITRQRHLAIPTDNAEALATVAAELMRQHWKRTRAIRLIGLRAGRLGPTSGAAQLILPFGQSVSSGRDDGQRGDAARSDASE